MRAMPRVNAVRDALSKRPRLVAAVAWRWLWAGEDRIRGLVWSDQRGFEPRSRPAEVTSVAESRNTSSAGSIRRPRSSCLGVIAPAGSQVSTPVLAEAGRFYGLDVYQAAPHLGAPMLERALREHWPLVGVAMESHEPLPSSLAELLRAYVAAGGTLLVNGIVPGSERGLAALSAALGVALPGSRAVDGTPSEVIFTEKDAAFAGEFAGVGIEASGNETGLSGCERATTLASIRGDQERLGAVSELRVGPGRVILCAGTQGVSRLSDAMAPLRALTVLPAMMLVRQVYGDVAWRTPESLAGFVVDDPALRKGTLGLDYPRVLAQAREHGFHLTVATIPRELELAEPAVVDLLRVNGRWLSACYHGSDHSGYEFYLPAAKESRYRSRSLSSQEKALRRAVARGERFAARTGLALDRVMVFPHGIGSPQIFSSIQALGFIAACNFDDRYPLGAPTPDDYDLGARPADLAWSGFPLIWRRGLPDRMYLLDLFLGRPAITFGHVKALGADMAPFVRRADEIHRLGGGRVRWTSLEDISRHSYLQRRDPKLGWLVSMFSNEICLHNPEPRPRSLRVERANSPEEYSLVADCADSVDARGLTITIPPGEARTIKLVSPRSRSLSPGRSCSIERAGEVRSTA
jgi:hypothetical protein